MEAKEANSSGKVIVAIPPPADRRFKAWRRLVTGVDTSRHNGYAFAGEFLPAGRKAELPVGAYVLIYDVVGTNRHNKPVVVLAQVTAEGRLVAVEDDAGKVAAVGEDWVLDLRDRVAQFFKYTVTCFEK